MANEGVNQVDENKGIWSPTQNRWIGNDEISNYFAGGKRSADDIVSKAGDLGINPYAINHAINLGDHANYSQLANKVSQALYTGRAGYGYDFDSGGGTYGSTNIRRGNGNTQYLMPDGGYATVRIHNFRPDQSYDQALAGFNANQNAQKGIINSATQHKATANGLPTSPPPPPTAYGDPTSPPAPPTASGLPTTPPAPPGGTPDGDPSVIPTQRDPSSYTGVSLPDDWNSYSADQKIAWFNQNNTGVKTLKQNGVDDATIGWMVQHGYNPNGTPSTTGTTGTTTTGSGSSGPGVWKVDPNQTVVNQFASITDPNSPLMQQARTRALQEMNGRGLTNSSMSQTAADSAMYDAAVPIARQDASTYADAAKTNAGFQTQWNINQANNQLQRDLQAASIAAQKAMQSASINSQAQLQKNSQIYSSLAQGNSNATSIYTWLNNQIAAIYQSDLSADAKQKLVDQVNAQANSSLSSIQGLTQTMVNGAKQLGLS